MSVPGLRLPDATIRADDAELIRRAMARDDEAVRAIMKANNRRLYRIARGVLGNPSEAEDVVQEAYVRAFTSLAGFRSDATLSTWLSRIVINAALGRLRKGRRAAFLAEPGRQTAEAQILQFPLTSQDDPERTIAQRQLLQLAERATDNLPSDFRSVFVARVIEGLSTEETAELLGIRAETVKTRLHRARRLVRKQLDEEIGPVLMDAFPFAGRRCELLTVAVLRRLDLSA